MYKGKSLNVTQFRNQYPEFQINADGRNALEIYNVKTNVPTLDACIRQQYIAVCAEVTF